MGIEGDCAKEYRTSGGGYNATLEAEWEGRNLEERNGELQQALGLSYALSRRFALGAEFLHEIAFENCDKAGPGIFFAGPNVTVRSGAWWATATALAQIIRAGQRARYPSSAF
jgi:hypothetical protein